MAIQQHQLHFVVVPLMSPGHFVPQIDFAKLLAQQGVTVTVITTPLVALRYTSLVNRMVESRQLPIRFVQLRFPYTEVGLPEGTETLETVTSRDLIEKFFHAISILQQPLEQLFKQLEPTPSCLIADKNFPWLADTARKFQIPRIMFEVMSCFTVLASHNLHISGVHKSLAESERFLLPGLPDRIEVTKAQLPGGFNPGSVHMPVFRKQVREAEAEAYGVLIHSFEELEPRYVEECRKVIKGGRVWCIGPLSLCNKDNLDKAERGNKASIDEAQCLEWLDSQKPGSVVYVCFGSLNRVIPPQLIELGLALEESKRPFVWVNKGTDKTGELEKWIEEYGFEERTRGRGLLIRGWAPQILILSHPSVGAYLTHCGWNSTMEGICAGVPLITWPMFAEQFFNEKLVVEILKIGVGVGAEVAVHLTKEDKFGVLVKREAIGRAVEEAMSGGKEGESRRERASVIRETAKRAMEEGGSSQINLKLLIQDVMQQASSKAQFG